MVSGLAGASVSCAASVVYASAATIAHLI